MDISQELPDQPEQLEQLGSELREYRDQLDLLGQQEILVPLVPPGQLDLLDLLGQQDQQEIRGIQVPLDQLELILM
jgi:hypothetical protein